MANLFDYLPAYEPSDPAAFFAAVTRLAESIGATVGLTRAGRIVLTLYGAETAQDVSARLTSDDFPFGYVEPGTDSILILAF